MTMIRLAALTLLAISAHAADPVITIDAGKHVCRVSELTRGVNMEDLHYQMTGGISSQLIHGESFFEPSHAAWARRYASIDGFMTAGGTSLASDGVLTLQMGDASPATSGGAPIQWPIKDPGVRITSIDDAPAGMAGLAVALRFPAQASGTAALLWSVHENHAHDRWEWYAGYSVELQPRTGRVVLRRAQRANQHIEVAGASCPIPLDAWVTVALRQDANHLSVLIDGRQALAWEDARPLPPARFGLAARDRCLARGLQLLGAAEARRAVPFTANPLLTAPDDGISLRWSRIQAGTAQGSFALTGSGWHGDRPSQELAFTGGEGEIGIDNAGLQRWGLALKAGRAYEGFLRLRSDSPTEVVVSLRSADGTRLHAQQIITTSGTAETWDRPSFTLVPTADDGDGRFAITLRHPGHITVGYVFLQPGAWGRFKGLPIRRDLAEALIVQGTKLLRLNGGMIERPGYRWANMQGPRDQRPPFDGFYDRWCSNGYGVIEHLALCEAAGFTPLIGLNLDETPGAYADFVAYANAQADTPAGGRRAADGHPAPYRMAYLQVANESGMNDRYLEKFKQVAEAVWAVDPDITLVTTGNTHRWTGDEKPADMRKKLAVHLALTRWVKERGKKLLWDVHAFNTGDATDQPRQEGGQTRGLIAFSRWMTRLAPELGPVPVGNLEFNAGSFDHHRGLQHATELGVLHRAGDVVVAGAMPNTSQPWGVYQSDWKAVLWTQGSIYYTQDRVWFQSSYLVDRMVAGNWTPNVVQTGTTVPELDVIAGLDDARQRLALRVVNHADRPVSAALAVNGWVLPPQVVVEELAGDPGDCNTREQPEHLRIVTRSAPATPSWTFPAHAFTILRWEQE